MLIHSISQLLTLSGGPQRGHTLGNLGIIQDGAVLVRNGKIAAVGTSNELSAAYPDEQALDAGSCVLMPGMVDAHTHLIWAGDRAFEFEMRLQGKTYMEIMAAGGGIQSTVNATRQASLEELKTQTHRRAKEMFRTGTTTAEAKTGYSLELNGEMNLLQVLLDLDHEGPLELWPTFFAAHAIPFEYKDNPQEYTNLICQVMLPEVKKWWQMHTANQRLPFVDAFCEKGAFTLEQTRQILTTGRQLGFSLKVHVDEFENLGGAQLAVDLGAVSADHLIKTSQREILALANSNTVAVALPCTPFGLAESEYTQAHAFLEADGLFAIASDLNPGTAWGGNMQFVIALACRYLHLTPAQAITAATINAAAAINRADQIGSIEIGKQADLLILNVADYRHLGYRFGDNLVKTVIKRGEVYEILETAVKKI